MENNDNPFDSSGEFNLFAQPSKSHKTPQQSEQPTYLSVSQVNDYVHRMFNHDRNLNYIYLKGEISNYRYRPGGHQYFCLKDENSIIHAVMFRSSFRYVKFRPKEGMKVLVHGRVQTYARAGQYQIVVTHMEPSGIGSLYEAYEQLKAKLAKQGLFNPVHKKQLPAFPRQIAVITSQSGAVIRDIIVTARKRWPYTRIVLFPAPVQGEGAGKVIAQKIQQADDGSYDDLIIGRGGGSIEDLWPFNTEVVADAIYNCQTPVISSVGHETDTTIADMVADLRVATPTAAAEQATPNYPDVVQNISNLKYTITQVVINQIKILEQRLNKQSNSYVYQNPQRMLETKAQTLDIVSQRLKNAVQNKINSAKQNIQSKENRIKLLHQSLLTAERNIIKNKQNSIEKEAIALNAGNPLNAVDRGYSMVTQKGHIISSSQSVQKGQKITIQLKQGSIQATVDKRIN